MTGSVGEIQRHLGFRKQLLGIGWFMGLDNSPFLDRHDW
jgi:hypothetical protein